MPHEHPDTPATVRPTERHHLSIVQLHPRKNTFVLCFRVGGSNKAIEGAPDLTQATFQIRPMLKIGPRLSKWMRPCPELVSPTRAYPASSACISTHPKSHEASLPHTWTHNVLCSTLLPPWRSVP